MNLDDYLIELATRRTPTPDTLTLPPTFVSLLGDLYTTAEANGLERGGPVLFAPPRTFALGEVANGLATSMNIPVSDHPGNFGEVHAHPSASIGHAGGYSAHSMQDLAKFDKTKDKPFWIQFVASGPWLYAMVQVNGVSKWDDTVNKFLGARHKTEEDRMFDAVVDYVGGQKKWLALAAKAGGDTDPEARTKLYAEYKPKANIGPLMQDLSVTHCAEFARQYNFFFYTGQNGTLTRMLTLA